MGKSTRTENKTRWWDFLAAVLLFLCLFVATLRLLATHWTNNLQIIQSIAFLGAILGLAIGQSIFKRWVSVFFSIAYGIIIIPWRLGLLMGADIVWTERLISMRGRMITIIGNLASKDAVTDNLLFLFLMSCLFWVLSIHAGYVITRYAHPWKAVLPTGVAIFIIHSFDPLLVSRSWYLAVYLFFALLLIARLVFLQKRYSWKQTRTHTPSDVGFDFSRLAVIATVVLILLAWNLPVLAGSLSPVSQVWVTVTRPWQSLKERFEFAFASLRASVGLVTDMYGESMMLGIGTPLSERVVLEVEGPNVPLDGVRFYWRARVYDSYYDGGWFSSFNYKQVLTPKSPDIDVPGAEIREDVSLTMSVYDSVSLMYTASQPLWVSRPATASVMNNPDGTYDLGALAVNEFIRPGEKYETRSSLSTVSIKQLREAGTDYPQWVTDRYLQLPDDITLRTLELAQRIASGYETPYDIAQAVTNYLRNNITYKQVISKIPSGHEPVDWFLFDLHQGYCNYYATAEVIMLRSLSIPARLAVGFSQGEQISTSSAGHEAGLEGIPPEEMLFSYVVRHKNAHAWPEVFFPGIGWVEFEPTSSQDALIRPSGEDLPVNPSNYQPEEHPRDLSGELLDEDILAGLDTPEDVTPQVKFWTLKTTISLVLILFIIALVIITLIRARRGRRLIPTIQRWGGEIPKRIEKGFLRFGIPPPRIISRWAAYLSLPRLSRSYLEINRALNRMGQRPNIYDTPTERVVTLTGVLPLTQEPAYQLLNEYQTSMYSLHQADEDAGYKAGREIRRQSLLAAWKKWFSRFQEPIHTTPPE